MVAPLDCTTTARSDMTADQLRLASSARVAATTAHGRVVGGRVRNGCQVFLNVPYGLDVARWEDPRPLPPSYRYPTEHEYTVDGLYCAQPGRSYTAQIPIRDRLGQGAPTENPFFADIYVPSGVDLSHPPRLPVRVFVHGGFLQFGSTSGQHYNQQFFAAEARHEVRVLLGHRLSALGFLASASAGIPGNYGFKDVWLGLEWVQRHIASFGGDPAQVHLSGLSGGAHVVHQLLHRAAALSPAPAPFVTALLQSNGIVSDPLTPSERETQFAAFCAQLGADPASPSILAELRDTARYPTAALVAAVENMGLHSTFRGVVEAGWLRADQMAFQRSGGLGAALSAAGVRCVIAGDVRDEDAFYGIVHDVTTATDLLPNVARYYPLDVAQRLLAAYPPLDADAPRAQCQARLGRVLADGQVHLPVRLLCRDLAPALPTVRYAVEMVPRALGTGGLVTHGSDTAIQHLRLSVLSADEEDAAVAWHDAVSGQVGAVMNGSFTQRPEDEVLLLSKNGRVGWARDWRWDELRAVEAAALADDNDDR
ncbi:putative esterase/lipase [Vanrija pseudolonga]|uniref:Carboxylic ester hydrolase n=1 Tax=Vanrija pseudolonga TaxID=143232 RepID=A0AAF0YB48_9TREE|nr:purtative esterase/lipase [Vanrija pseudolonga]